MNDPSKPKWWQYADNIFLGGAIQGTQDEQRARAALQGLQGLFAPQHSSDPGAVQYDDNGQPIPGTVAPPSLASIAPQLADAASKGVNLNPLLGLFGDLREEKEAGQGQTYNTSEGLFHVGPGGQNVRNIWAPQPEAPAPFDPLKGAPPGMAFTDATRSALSPLPVVTPGGPVSSVNQFRRDVLTRNPMPSRAKPKTPTAAAPWKRGWSQ